MSISKERREELREALQAMADGDGLMIPYRDAVALLDTADELDRLTLDAEDQSWREALADAADLDITGSDVRGDREQPHTPTVAAALRERVMKLEGCLKECAEELRVEIAAQYPERGFRPDELRRYKRDMEPVEKAETLLSQGGREDG